MSRFKVIKTNENLTNLPLNVIFESVEGKQGVMSTTSEDVKINGEIVGKGKLVITEAVLNYLISENYIIEIDDTEI